MARASGYQKKGGGGVHIPNSIGTQRGLHKRGWRTWMIVLQNADLAGLLTAHDAYVLSLKGKTDVVIRGLTGEQRFFLAFAQRWRKAQSERQEKSLFAGQ